MDKEIFTLPQAAKYCSLSRSTLWKYVRSGDLRASLTPGRHYRIHRRDLESFLRKKGMYPFSSSEPHEKRILIADNDRQALDFFAEVLSCDGYRTKIARNWFEAGFKIMEFRPKLLILDLFMPGVDGFDVCRRIKQNQNTSNIKILGTADCYSEEIRLKTLKAGADAYLEKPVDREQLVQSIEALLDGKTRP